MDLTGAIGLNPGNYTNHTISAPGTSVAFFESKEEEHT